MQRIMAEFFTKVHKTRLSLLPHGVSGDILHIFLGMIEKKVEVLTQNNKGVEIRTGGLPGESKVAAIQVIPAHLFP